MPKGLVIKSTGSWYYLKNEKGELVPSKIRGKLRNQDFRTTNPISVGDWVEFEMSEKENTGIITGICERKNYIIRKSSNLSKQAQIIAANVDYVMLVVTLVYPETTTLFIDRFLATTEAYRIKTILVFNKSDLYSEPALHNNLKEWLLVYETAGYQCFVISVLNNENIDKLRNHILGKTTVISGNSGVGKSAIIKALNPKINIRIGEISKYHKSGKHTTTFAEMFEIDPNSYIIDTPGIKGFGLIDMEKNEIYHFFPEIFKFAVACQYYNCLHIQEPGCAVKKAVEEGKIHLSRYSNYLTIYLNDERKHRQ